MKNILNGIDWKPIVKFFGLCIAVFFAVMTLVALGNSSVGYKWWVFVPNAVLYAGAVLWLGKKLFYTKKTA